MKRSDIYLVIGLYAICGAFYGMTTQLSDKAAVYPLFVMSILAIFVTIYAIQMIVKFNKTKKVEKDTEMFEGFLPKQFFFVLITALIYIILINFLGFYIATVIYLIICLLGLKVKKSYILMTTASFCIVVYVAFTLFLRVPLPTGLLF